MAGVEAGGSQSKGTLPCEDLSCRPALSALSLLQALGLSGSVWVSAQGVTTTCRGLWAAGPP